MGIDYAKILLNDHFKRYFEQIEMLDKLDTGTEEMSAEKEKRLLEQHIEAIDHTLIKSDALLTTTNNYIRSNEVPPHILNFRIQVQELKNSLENRIKEIEDSTKYLCIGGPAHGKRISFPNGGKHEQYQEIGKEVCTYNRVHIALASGTFLSSSKERIIYIDSNLTLNAALSTLLILACKKE